MFDRSAAVLQIWLMEQRLLIMNNRIDRRFHLKEYRKYHRKFFRKNRSNFSRRGL